MSLIIQIVPRRAIEPEGVGDYARLIAERLLEDHGIRTVFIGGQRLPADKRAQDGWETHQLPEQTAEALMNTLTQIGGDSPLPVILHVSGYGYQRKGTPFWLAKGMEGWRRRYPATPLISIFHEIHATGPITGSAFWLAPLQRRVARRILRVSTAAITTMSRFANLLRSWVREGRPPISLSAVFSNVGENDGSAVPPRQPPILAIFGGGTVTDEIYGRGRGALEAFIAREKIEAIIDIGKRSVDIPAVVAGVPVEILGETPAAVIRARLATARFGMMSYNADFLAKSGIFAAYCALGVIPVCLSESLGMADGLLPGENYIKLDSGSQPAALASSQVDALQSAAYEWYMRHPLSATVRIIYDALHGQPVVKGS